MRGTASPRAGARSVTLWICVGLAVAVWLPYAQVARHEFVHWDDDSYVFDNPVVRQGLTGYGARWAFSTTALSNWHPLTWLSHMLDVELFGLDPTGHHLVSVALHAANAVLLFLVLQALAGSAWRPALAAALFAVHPLRVESVAWVSERKDVLSGLFWMLALLAWCFYVRRESLGRYLLVAAAFLLGLLAKPMLVTLPCVLLLLDIWPLGRWRFTGWNQPAAGTAARPLRWLILEKLPLLALSAASSVVTIVAQRSGGSLGTLEHLPLGSRLANALASNVTYLWKTVWPSELACFYPHPGRISPWGVGAGLLLGGLTYAVMRGGRRRPYLTVGWFWYLITLLPVIGVVQVGLQAMADRYTYLPAIGIYLIGAWGAGELAAARPRWHLPVQVAASLMLTALVAVTWSQVRTWRNSQFLFEHALRVTGPNFVMHNNLGNVFQRQGDLGRAAEQYQLALQLRPDYAKAHNNLGIVLERRGDLVQAAAQYERAIHLDPAYAEAYRNLGGVLGAQGKLEQAVAQYEQALRLRPDYAEAHINLGSVLERLGQREQAKLHFERALQADPASAEAYNNLGVVLRGQGEFDSAATYFERAVRLRPDYAAAYNNLGATLEKLGRLDEAAAQYEQALRIAPRYSEAHNNLGIVFAKRGDLERAAVHFERALALKPDNATARQNLERARALLQSGGSPPR